MAFLGNDDNITVPMALYIAYMFYFVGPCWQPLLEDFGLLGNARSWAFSSGSPGVLA